MPFLSPSQQCQSIEEVVIRDIFTGWLHTQYDKYSISSAPVHIRVLAGLCASADGRGLRREAIDSWKTARRRRWPIDSAGTVAVTDGVASWVAWWNMQIVCKTAHCQFVTRLSTWFWTCQSTWQLPIGRHAILTNAWHLGSLWHGRRCLSCSDGQ